MYWISMRKSLQWFTGIVLVREVALSDISIAIRCCSIDPLLLSDKYFVGTTCRQSLHKHKSQTVINNLLG
jgi:hypothetical protein